MNGHYGIFPSWECQLSCVYCSIRNSRIDRTVKGVPWQEWGKALRRYVPRGSIVDIAGGEPFLYPGIIPLLRNMADAGIRWAITTNGKATAVIDELCQTQPWGCVVINISDHRGNPEAFDNAEKLWAAGFRLSFHRVNHPMAGHNFKKAQVITYQPWKEGNAVDGIRRKCNAGVHHWVAGPNGDLWRCVVAMEVGQPVVGNLFTGETHPTKAECDFGCTTAYTEDPASWCLEMQAKEAHICVS